MCFNFFFLFTEVLMAEMNDNGVFYNMDQIIEALSDELVSTYSTHIQYYVYICIHRVRLVIRLYDKVL